MDRKGEGAPSSSDPEGGIEFWARSIARRLSGWRADASAKAGPAVRMGKLPLFSVSLCGVVAKMSTSGKRGDSGTVRFVTGGLWTVPEWAESSALSLGNGGNDS